MDQQPNKPRKVCILVSGEYFRRNHVREIQGLLDETDVEISLVAIDDTGPAISETTPHSAEGVKADHIKKFFVAIKDRPLDLLYVEDKLAQILTNEKTAEEKRASIRKNVPIENLEPLEEVDHHRFVPTTEDGITYEVPDETVDKITSNADVVVLLGFNRILRGRILDEPEYGVLSFHQTDIRRYRGRPAPFWQFWDDRDTAGITLQRLNERLDGGELVYCEHTDVSDCSTLGEYHLALDRLFGSLLAEGITRLQQPDWEPEELTGDVLGTLYLSRFEYLKASGAVSRSL